MDFKSLRQEATYVAGTATDSWTEGVANALIQIIDNPALVVPEGYSLVRKPELTDRGVPGSTYKP